MCVHNKKKKLAISGCVNIGYTEYLCYSKLTTVFTPCVGGTVRALAQLGARIN